MCLGGKGKLGIGPLGIAPTKWNRAAADPLKIMPSKFSNPLTFGGGEQKPAQQQSPLGQSFSQSFAPTDEPQSSFSTVR